MKRGPPYVDANANQFSASQMQHMSAQRMQPNSTINNFPGRPDSFPGEEERQYTSRKEGGQWQWDRDAQQMSPHLYGDGQGGNSSKSFYPSQIPDSKLDSNQQSRVRPQEQDVEIGYGENPAPQTLEGLEQKFHDDITKLTKDQVVAEDAETARHREKIIEINNQYQEKLSALRARHATRREEFLRKESQARLQQYQLSRTSHHQNNSGPSSEMGGEDHHHGYGGGGQGPVSGEPQRQYGGGGGGGGGGQFDSYRHHPDSFGRGRIQGPDSRVPTPGGRVYNTGPRYY